MAGELPELTLADAAAWQVWLAEHHQTATGVWLVLAKKDTTQPISLSYDQALDEALCHGWIDGQVQRRDETTYRQRFTPRRPRSPWSALNVSIIARLVAEGRMHPAGVAQVKRAKVDGRWDAAYAGQASIEVPADLADALTAQPRAQANVRRSHQPEPLRRPLPDRQHQTRRNPSPSHRTVRRHACPRRDGLPAEAHTERLTMIR